MSPLAAARSDSVLGVDIGGTKILAAVVGPDGEPGPSARATTPAGEGPRAVLDTAISTARTVLAAHGRSRGDGAGHSVRACGIGTAGTVGPDGVISHATDTLPGWAGTDVRAAFADALDLPAVVLNDVHAAAVGERAYGAARGHGTALVIWIGTGIGGAIVAADGVLSGRTGTAGAVGHVPVPVAVAVAVDGDGQRCTCGAWDHLEAYAAGPAITARYMRRAAAEGCGKIADDQACLPAIASLARAGEPLALSVIEQAGTAIGGVLGGLANVLDPDVIVLGGGVAAVADLLERPVRRALADQALPGPARVVLAFSGLGPMAAVIGASVAARTSLLEVAP